MEPLQVSLNDETSAADAQTLKEPIGQQSRRVQQIDGFPKCQQPCRIRKLYKNNLDYQIYLRDL
jgi:hypothetical protein